MGMLEQLTLLLKQVDSRDPFVWNSVIRGLEQNNKPWKAIDLFSQMLHEDVSPDKFTFPFVLKACARVLALREGEQAHSWILKSPLSSDLFVQGSLISMYASCHDIDSAHATFDSMLHKNLISWNIMIDACVKHGMIGPAIDIFDQMPQHDLFSWNLMIDGLIKCGEVEHARRLFDVMPKRDIISWNSMINGYARCGNMKAATQLFGMTPCKDEVTWGIMLNGYAKIGQIGIAHSWFEKLPYKNSVNRNCLIDGYAKSKDIVVAEKMFGLMPQRNLTSFNIMLDAYVKQLDLKLAHELFDDMPAKDVFSWNIMIDGNAKLGRINIARELFDTMPQRDVVSWNAIIDGYKENGKPKDAIELYNQMQKLGVKSDSSTLVVVLTAIADLGLLPQGRSVHAIINRNNIPLNSAIGVALIDMYSKCGNGDIAMKIFHSISHKSIDHWNVIISGVAMNGHGTAAINLFLNMEDSLVVPDDITFIGVLSACSHAGLVEEGYKYFKLMNLKYGITPKIQHYGCMVDLLSRAGHLTAAILLVKEMPVNANDVIWRALLGASRNHGNIEIAEDAAHHLIELVPDDSSSYVLLSNIYFHKGQHDNAKALWRTMKERGVLKTPACSFIELDGTVHEFKAGHSLHAQITEIYLLLNNMTQTLAEAGYMPDYMRSVFDSGL